MHIPSKLKPRLNFAPNPTFCRHLKLMYSYFRELTYALKRLLLLIATGRKAILSILVLLIVRWGLFTQWHDFSYLKRRRNSFAMKKYLTMEVNSFPELSKELGKFWCVKHENWRVSWTGGIVEAPDFGINIKDIARVEWMASSSLRWPI